MKVEKPMKDANVSQGGGPAAQESVEPPLGSEPTDFRKSRRNPSDAFDLDAERQWASEAAESWKTRSPELIKKTLAKQAEIFQTLTAIENFLRATFSGVPTSEQEIRRTAKHFLDRTHAMMGRLADKSIADEEVLKGVENVSVEELLFLGSFKSLQESSHPPTLDEVAGVDFSVVRGGVLSVEDIASMRDIYAHNYTETPELQSELLKKFDEITRDRQTEFYVFRYQRNIRGFNAFTAHGMAQYEFRAFNVDQSFSRADIGEAMMRASLDIKARDSHITADCAITSPIAMNYIERGFVASALYSYKSVPSFHIERADAINAYYVGKRLTREEIVRWARDESVPPHIADARVYELDSEGALSADKFNDHRVLTRYFREGEKVYVVFEPGQSVSLDEIMAGTG